MATRYQFIDDSGETRLAGTLEPDPGGSSPVLVETVRLSSADILALGSTPITLAAGQAGYAISPLLLTLIVLPGGAPYVGAVSLRAFIGPTFAGSGWGAIAFSQDHFTRATAGGVLGNLPGAFDGDIEDLSLLDGQPLRFDAGGAISAGDGTAVLTVAYFLSPTA